jgi:NAD(P)-dependent dehydrogenase (short-subunit alcohol dehydrogenase family)
MSVLVIGATGFIGPRVIRRLVARGESVVGMDLNPAAATFAGVPVGAPVVRGDVTQFEDVMRTVLDVKPDRLINLAYGLGAGEGNPHQVMRLDILGMDNCFEAARLAGVKRVVYASSVAVSGQQSNFGDRLATEDDPTYGTSQYAMHKIFNEFQAKKYIKNYGMSITGVRPANVTGPDKVRGSVDHVQIMVDAARGPAGAPAGQGPHAALDPRRGHGRGLHPHPAGRCAPSFALQLGRHPGEPRRARGHRARVPAGRTDHVRQGRRAARNQATTWLTGAVWPRSLGSSTPDFTRACSRSSTKSGKQRGCRWSDDSAVLLRAPLAVQVLTGGEPWSTTESPPTVTSI